MDASPYEPAEPSRLRLLLDHFSRIEDRRSPEERGSPAGRDSAGVRLRHDRRVRQFRRHLRLGKGPSRVPAAVPAVRLGRSLGALGQHHDEPDRSGPVRRLLHGLGPRLLARAARRDRHRRQDRAPQPRPGEGTGRAASGLRLRRRSRLVLGQEAVDDKTNETTAIPLLLEKLAAGRSLEGAVVTIDAIACNPQGFVRVTAGRQRVGDVPALSE